MTKDEDQGQDINQDQMINQNHADYAVGYKKPPKQSQFKAGQSGNRKGRPKGSLNFTTEIDRELATRVTVKEKGQNKLVTKKRIIAKQLVNKAAGGDLKASAMLLGQANINDQKQMVKAFTASETVAKEDQLVMANLLKRFREYAPSASVISAEIVQPAQTVETEATPVSTAITEIHVEPARSVRPTIYVEPTNDHHKGDLI